MRVFRTILGMLMLTVGLPALLVGAGLWTTMQHRDAGGAFSATLQTVTTPGYAVVVEDVDTLLDNDAPFARIGNTRLRVTSANGGEPAFVGLAPTGDAARYLSGVAYTSVNAVNLGTGALPLRANRIAGSRPPVGPPAGQAFWLSSGSGQLDWNAADMRGRPYSLVIMQPSAEPGLRLQAAAEVRPGWLNSATWALLMLGSILVIGGMVVLAWPGRRREVVYVVEPSQVPELARRIGAPLPIGSGPGRHSTARRPRTLADATTARSAAPKVASPRALPELTWPPARSEPSSEPALVTAGAPARSAPRALNTKVPAGDGVQSTDAVSNAAGVSGAADRASDTAQVSAQVSAIGSEPIRATDAPADAARPDVPVSSREPAGDSAPSSGVTTPHRMADSQGEEHGKFAAVDRAPDPSRAGDRLGAIPGPLPGGRLTPLPSGRPVVERTSRRRAADQPTAEGQIFEASAVGAWVAETAAARARETRATATLATESAAAKLAGTREAGAVGAKLTSTQNASSEKSTPTPTPTPTPPAEATVTAASPVAAVAEKPASASPSVSLEGAASPVVPVEASASAPPGLSVDTAALRGLAVEEPASSGPARSSLDVDVSKAPVDEPKVSVDVAKAPVGESKVPAGEPASAPFEQLGVPDAESTAVRPDVPASRMPINERRRATQAGEAGTEGTTGQIPPDVDSPSAEGVAVAGSNGPDADTVEHAVPVARGAGYQEEAKELLDAGVPARRRRKNSAVLPPVDTSTESTGKPTRATRRSGQPRPPVKE